MAASVERRKRTVIPRWRIFKTTAEVGELIGIGNPPLSLPDFSETFSKRLQEWKEHKTLWHATDLLNSAIMAGKEFEVVDAARFVLRSDSGASEVAKHVADRVVSQSSTNINKLAGASRLRKDLPPSFPNREGLRDNRQRVRRYPRNAIAWIDLARSYLTIGRHEKADRAVRIAIGLGSASRFVLRSAARFFVHQGNPLRAYELLRSAAGVEYDPWLASAAIASASSAGISPRGVRVAKNLLTSQKFSDFHTSELAAALATLEFHNGKHKGAKKLFRRALRRPTENALAQAEYASFEIAGLVIDAANYRIPRSFEAKAWDYYKKGNWDAALQNSKKWLLDQPFSSRPVMMASYLESVIFERPEAAENILVDALKANAHDATLLNNMAYSLAMQNRLEEAEYFLKRGFRASPSVGEATPLIATQGLIHLRQGHNREGKRLYLNAIEIAERSGLKEVKALASIHHALQEVEMGINSSREIVDKALQISENVADLRVKFLRERLRTRTLRMT